MPQVPMYDSPQVQQSALPNARVEGGASLESFGGGQGLQQFTQATQGVSEQAQKIIQEEKQKADVVAHIASDRQASDLQTNIQLAASKMQGKDAAGAPDYVKRQWEKGVQEIQGSLSNDDQKMAFARSSNARFEELNKFALVHSQTQMEKYADNESQGYIDTSRNAAVLNNGDDQKINNELERQKAVFTDLAVRKGIYKGPDGQVSQQYKDGLNQILSQTHKEVINARLDGGNVDEAKEYFDAHKADMTGQDQVTASKVIEDRQTVGQAMEAYDKVSGMKLADGQPNEVKMRAVVMNMDVSDEKKEQIWSYVKARGNEDFLNKNRQDAANERSFMNQAVQTRTQGQPMEEALKLVDKYAIDPYDKTLKTQAIQAIYAPPKESDTVAKYNMWQGIQSGSVTMSDIDKAFQDNKLNAKDWSQLKEENYKMTVEGKSPEMKYTNDRIKEMAIEKLGGDKKKIAEYINIVNQEGMNLSPEQKFKKAQDLLQKDPNSQHSFFGVKWGGVQQYKTDVQTRDAQTLAFGKAKEDLGPDVVKAIGQGVLQNKPNFTPGDLDAFSVRMGGYDKIKPGTPANDAMQWLMKKGMPVVPENVSAVVQRRQIGKK